MSTQTDWQAVFDTPAEPAAEPAVDEDRTTATTTRPRRRAPSSGPERAVRRALAVAALARHRRDLLAALVGQRGYDDSEPARVRLVLSALQGSALAPTLSRALALAEAEPLEAGVLAAELAADRQALSTAWAAVGAEGTPPSHRPGLTLARAAAAMPPGRRHDLEALLEVLS